MADAKLKVQHELWATQHCARLYKLRALCEWRRLAAKWRAKRKAHREEAEDLVCRGWEAWRQVHEYRRCVCR